MIIKSGFTTPSQQRCVTVPNIRVLTEMTSCQHYHCLYIGDHSVECVHTVSYMYRAGLKRKLERLVKYRNYKIL